MSSYSVKDHRLDLYWFLVGVIAIALCVSFYTYFLTQDYLFLVEAPCDPAAQVCYARDCEEEECPPNGLSTYRVFALKASQFAQCSDNSCENLCVGDGCDERFCEPGEDARCEGPGGTL